MTRRELLGRTILGAHIAVLAACGGDDDEKAEQPRAAPTAPRAAVPKIAVEQVTVRLAAVEDQFLQSVERAIALWNDGGVAGAPAEIRLERATGLRVAPARDMMSFIERAQAGARTFLTEQAAAGTPPDLMFFNPFFDFVWVYRSGLVQPLDRHLQQDRGEPLAGFLSAALDLVRFRGRTLALPVALDVGAARYNSRQFTNAGISLPESGWSRAEFISAAQRLTRDTDNDGKPDAWGFRPEGAFANWLPFVMQEMDEDVVDFDTGAVRLTHPAALRGLQFWDDLGRVHKIMPHGAAVTADAFAANFLALLAGILFWSFTPPSQNLPGQQTSLPRGSRDGTPLMLSAALAMPAAALDPSLAYAALAPLALHLGERLFLPAVTAGQQYIQTPSADYLELALPEQERQLVLDLLATARPSLLATSYYMVQELFPRLTLPLARGEVDVVQAARQGQEWLESYLDE